MLVSLASYSQIYTEPLDIEYSAIMYTPTDSSRNYIIMSCTGAHFRDKKSGKKVDDTWYAEWSIPVHTSMIDGQVEEFYEISNGLITENNVELYFSFMPSPRYEKLDYCPIPLVQFPLQEGKTWDWHTESVPTSYPKQVDGENGPEWRLVKDTTFIKSSYKVNRKRDWYYSQERKYIECYEVQATGKSKKGDTRLTTYYSPEYGFVYLDFETIDYRRYIFEMRRRYFVSPQKYRGRY